MRESSKRANSVRTSTNRSARAPTRDTITPSAIEPNEIRKKRTAGAEHQGYTSEKTAPGAYSQGQSRRGMLSGAEQ